MENAEGARRDVLAIIVEEKSARETDFIRFFCEEAHDKDDSNNSSYQPSKLGEVGVNFVETSLVCLDFSRFLIYYFKKRPSWVSCISIRLEDIWNCSSMLYLNVLSG